METWKANADKAARRRRARDRFLAARKAAKAANAPPSANNSLRRRCARWLPCHSCLPCLPTRQPAPQQQSVPPESDGHASPDGEQSKEAASGGGGGSLLRFGGSGECDSAKQGKGTLSAARRLVRMDTLTVDADFDEYCAWLIDRVALCVLFVGYITAAVLIFVLSSGYIDLFSQP